MGESGVARCNGWFISVVKRKTTHPRRCYTAVERKRGRRTRGTGTGSRQEEVVRDVRDRSKTR